MAVALVVVALGSVRLYAEPDPYGIYFEDNPSVLGTKQDQADSSTGDQLNSTTNDPAATLLQNTLLTQNTLQSETASMPPAQDCTLTSSQRSSFESSSTPEIRKLSGYESLCGGKFMHGSMLFTSMPASPSDAVEMAKDTAMRLKEFARFGLKPKVILEPLINGQPIDFAAFSRGEHDQSMHSYFDTLASEGITDELLGEVTSFPEPNIPEWGTTEPNLIAACITKAAQLQKAHFPHSLTSVLLDSKSYPSGTSWEGGQYASLAPYVAPIPKGLIDSFGLQGYPWPDPDSVHDPAVFLSANQALEAARILNVSRIWFNTGTFRRGVAWNNTTYTLSPSERYTILHNILNEAQKIRADGVEPEIMLFAENKLDTPEQIDWSYDLSDNGGSGHANSFKNFQHETATLNIPLYIFDTY